LLVFCTVGCTKLPKIKLPGAQVTGVQDAGTPATVERSQNEVVVPLPKDSEVWLEPYVIAGEKVRVAAKIANSSEIRATFSDEKASTGTIDPTVAQSRIEGERGKARDRIRLMAGIGLIVLGLGLSFALPAWLRWRQVGLWVAGAGGVLAFVPEPPAWALTLAAGAALSAVIVYYSVIKPKGAASQTEE
jgi:hypothetical protein